MPRFSLNSLLLASAAVLLTAGASNAEDLKSEWTPLFNGKDLTGWHNPYDWGKAEVVDGEIHLTANKKFFLCTEQKYGDFVLEGEVHLPEGPANSGFMFRCHVETNRVYGYQVEISNEAQRSSGNVYDEAQRGRFLDD